MQRITNKKKAKAGQYYLSHEEAEALEKLRQKRRNPARRARPQTAEEPRGLLKTLLVVLVVLTIIYVIAQMTGGL
ncbi:MAG: hypothetical protein KF770_17595 [Anaerolineae bacterium]|nr:hypothetical protein [Anaerolineae bacterium]